MLEEIGGWRNLSIGGILTLVILAILTGWLLPRWVYTEAVKARDTYKSAAETALLATQEHATNVQQLVLTVEAQQRQLQQLAGTVESMSVMLRTLLEAVQRLTPTERIPQ